MHNLAIYQIYIALTLLDIYRDIYTVFQLYWYLDSFNFGIQYFIVTIVEIWVQVTPYRIASERSDITGVTGISPQEIRPPLKGGGAIFLGNSPPGANILGNSPPPYKF